jgi:hypothetical protein
VKERNLDPEKHPLRPAQIGFLLCRGSADNHPAVHRYTEMDGLLQDVLLMY